MGVSHLISCRGLTGNAQYLAAVHQYLNEKAPAANRGFRVLMPVYFRDFCFGIGSLIRFSTAKRTLPK